MSASRRLIVTAGAIGLIGAGGMLAAPAASALSFSPSPGLGTVSLNQSDARAVDQANAAGAVDAVLPTWRDVRTGQSAGRTLDRYAAAVGRTPGAQLDITVTSPSSFRLHAHR
jgi:hypothetical protein